MDIVLLIIISAAAGFVAAWFFFRNTWFNKNRQLESDMNEKNNQINELTRDYSVATEKTQMLQEHIDKLNDSLAKKEESIIQLTSELSSRKTEVDNLEKRFKEYKMEVEELQNQFKLQFKNLANDILEEKTAKFTEQNKTNIDSLLKPLKEKIIDFEKKVEETYDKEAQQRFSLKEEVKRLAELNQKVSEDAKNLTKALKGESKTQGNWGEMILENILERSGLVKDREYFVQTSFIGDDGVRYQPDVVIKYPGDRSVIIDSKVSLVAYDRYVSAENDEEQDKAVSEHLVSIKNHVKELSSKNYQDLYQLKTLDFVMLFMPVEPAYLLAIQADQDLWNYAYDKRILMISPTNLIAALKMIASLWRQEYQNRNVMEIARQSGLLYDKFVGLINDLQDIGRKLDSTKKSYSDAMNKLSEGKGNLIGRVENIKKLGAKTKKEMPGENFENNETSIQK